MTVEEHGGSRREVFVPYVKGYPSHPMSKEEVDQKATELISLHLGSQKAKAIVEMVNNIESQPTVAKLLGLISR